MSHMESIYPEMQTRFVCPKVMNEEFIIKFDTKANENIVTQDFTAEQGKLK